MSKDKIGTQTTKVDASQHCYCVYDPKTGKRFGMCLRCVKIYFQGFDKGYGKGKRQARRDVLKLVKEQNAKL